MKIGSKIRKIRELKNIPVKEMADRLNMSIQGYSKIERNDVSITTDKLEEISKNLEVSLNELFDFGRPAQVELMVLADRGNRELPVCANFVGEQVQVPENQILVLERDVTGKLSFELEERE